VRILERLKIDIENTSMYDNIGECKQKIRTLAKEARAKISLAEKEHMEKIMVQRLCSLKEYKETSVILCYFSNDIEVSTKKIMEKAWEDNKLIAIPKCNNSDCSMQFYAINSYQDIKINEYGFGEPYENKLIIGDEHSICIVPGLVFDYRGYRIGYGSGYYDCFLVGYKGCKVGLTYSAFMQRTLPKERFDQKMDYLISEKFTKIIEK